MTSAPPASGVLLPLHSAAAAAPGSVARFGAKAARLAAAVQAGLPVLPGWVVPVSAGRAALTAGVAAVRGRGMAAGRRAVLQQPVPPPLAAELRAAAGELGGRVIVRSSSPLESDPRWAGAFSSVAEVAVADVVTAVRSCWAAAFAVDPLERLAASGLELEALELGLVIQPELVPDAGGTARADAEGVAVAGVAGHPGALLAGWADGAQARVRLAGTAASAAVISDGGLTGLLGGELIVAVARLAELARREIGDDVIEWAAAGGRVWLLQSLRGVAGRGQPGSGPAGLDGAARAAPASPAGTPGGAAQRQPDAVSAADPADPRLAAAAAALWAPGGGRLASRQWMPLLAAVTQTQGQQVPARPAAPGVAAGRLVCCRPHERPAEGSRDAVLLIERPVPALAPLLFGARGVIARTGAAASHLAEVARSLGVPMVTGCRLEAVTGPASGDQRWIAAIDGAAGTVAVLPGSG